MGVKFTEGAARRIVAATRAYERGSRDQPPIRFRQTGGDGGDGNIRYGRISETWTKGEYLGVEQLTIDGEVIPGGSFTAFNPFVTVRVPVPSVQNNYATSYRKVACGLAGDTWILLATECS